MNSKLPCYTVSRNEIFGRYLIANRDIKQGEIILKEDPLIIGAPIQAVPLCFKCSKRLHTNIQICPDCCIATVCSKFCTGNKHKTEECKNLKDSGLTPKLLIENPQVVMPLRCFLLRKYNSEEWDEFLQLEPHLDKRKDTWIWRMYNLNVQKMLEEARYLKKSDIDDEVIQKICGILDVNSFEVRSVQNQNNFNANECLRGVYLKAALMAHDCVGNTHLAVDDDFTLVVHASKAIKKGETIFFNYSNALLGSADRRHHLKEGKYFDCTCSRCADSTELGTEISSLVCPRCRSQSVRSSCSLPCTWKCSNCLRSYSDTMVTSTIREAKNRIEELDTSNLEATETLLKKCLLNFHPNHYLILELEQSLVALYSQNALTVKNLTRKVDLCKHLLNIFQIIEPGLSRLQAITMYELQAAQVQLAQKLYNGKEIRNNVFVERLLSSEFMIKEAIRLLLYEPSNSPEGRLTQRAMQELRSLRNIIAQAELQTPIKVVEDKKNKKIKPKKTIKK